MSGALRTYSELTAHGTEKLTERLVYYDLAGHRYEGAPASNLIDEALKLFAGTQKAVRRSSGGLVIAEPYQLIVYGDPLNPQIDPPSLRVRVKFRDFRRDEEGRVRTAEYITHKKTVTPDELREPFGFRPAALGHQRFVLDFGDGPVPIQVFHYEEIGGIQYAYFIEPAQAARVQDLPKRTEITLAIYRVERDVLRFAGLDPQSGESKEWESACRNYQRLVALGVQVVPGCLRATAPIAVAGGLTPQELSQQLRETMETRHAAQLPPQAPPVFTLDEEEGDLTPFGRFE